MFASSSKNALSAPLHSYLSTTGLCSSAKSSCSRVTFVRYVSDHAQVNRRADRDERRKEDRRRAFLQARPQTQTYTSANDNSVQFHRGGPPTMRYNMRLQDRLSRLDTIGVMQTVAEMKEKNVPPDIMTYYCLTGALAARQLHQEAWAAFHDMVAFGLHPDVQIFNNLITAVRRFPTGELYNVLEKMGLYGIQPNSKTYDLIITYYLEGGNFEVALCRLAEMNDLGSSPSLKVAHLLIDSAIEIGHVRLALDLAEGYEQSTVRRLDNDAWVKLLVGCAEHLYADGVQRCWDKAVGELRILLDEGLYLAVLHTAARHGIPSLAANVIRQLELLGVKLREHHLVPLLDAFINNSRFKEAVRVLDLMRSSGIVPTLDSAKTMLHSIRRDTETVDTAYEALEGLHKEGQTVDIVAANVVIAASRDLNDLQRAIGIYKALPILGIKPNIDTFNILLSACQQAKHLELGERLFAELQAEGLKPDAETFTTYIGLILTQADYENAFFFLEEMKGKGFKPSYSVYEAIVKKCVSVGDTRYKLAAEELEQLGYRMSSGLQSFIATGGAEWNETLSDEEKLPFATRKRIHAAYQKAANELDA